MLVTVVQATWLLPALGSLVIVAVVYRTWLLQAFGSLVIAAVVSSDSCSSLGDVATTSIRVSRVTQTAVVNLQVDRCRWTPCVLAFLTLLQRFYPHDAKRDIFYVLCPSIRLSQAGSYCTETA